MQQEHFQLKAITEQILQLNQARAKQKRLSLTAEQDGGIPFLVGDSRWIERILLKLVTNALNFTAHGYVKISTKLASRQGQQAVIQISVEDTGRGIAMEVQPTIFAPFKRLVPAYQSQYSGAGLGLLIIKQYVDDLSGGLYFESTPQQGSTFTCILPLRAALLQEEDTLLQDSASLAVCYVKTSLPKSSDGLFGYMARERSSHSHPVGRR